MFNRPILYTAFSLLLLLLIAGVVVRGQFTKGQEISLPIVGQRILGLMTGNPATTQSGILVDQLVQGAVQTTKDTFSEKGEQVKNQVISTVQNEVKQMTDAQITSVKQEICRSWGIVASASGEKQ